MDDATYRATQIIRRCEAFFGTKPLAHFNARHAMRANRVPASTYRAALRFIREQEQDPSPMLHLTERNLAELIEDARRA